MIINTKILSFKNFIPASAEIIKRFPFMFFYCAVIAVCTIIEIEREHPDNAYIYFNLIKSAALGLPLSFIYVILKEKNNWSNLTYYLLNAVTLIFVLAHYFYLPETINPNYAYDIKFGLLCFLFVTLITFLPFKGRDEKNGFWQYNKSIVVNYIFAHFSTGVLVGGILLALLALDKLFELNIDNKIYGETAVTLIAIFMPLLFLSNFPREFDAYRLSQEYPKIIKFFAQYILLPLVVIYFFILFAYEIKIIAQWNWPKGWVSWLVLGYSTLGFATILLLYPIKDREENNWLNHFYKWFFRALIPFIVMLFFAISTRIAEYGITEPRYFVYAISIGLSIITLYFIFSKAKNIRVIPIVVAVLTLLASYGPQSATSISMKSQKGQLEELLIKYNLLYENKIAITSDEIPFEDQKSISSKVTYLVQTHGLESIREWYVDFDLSKIETHSSYQQKTDLVELMGLKYINNWDMNNSEWTNLNIDKSVPFDIGSYDYLISVSGTGCPKPFTVGDTEYDVNYNKEKNQFEITNLTNLVEEDIEITLELGDTLNVLRTSQYLSLNSKLDPALLTFDKTGNKFDIRFIILSANGNVVDDTLDISNINAYLLIREK